MALPVFITDVCREYFGTHKTVRGKKQLVDNRCDSCPLRQPCLKFGAAPARTFGELDASRETFAAEARELLAKGAA
jgi:hypothetical protein